VGAQIAFKTPQPCGATMAWSSPSFLPGLWRP
jgi:hypothetical protein